MSLSNRLNKLENFIQSNKNTAEKFVCKYLLAVANHAEKEELDLMYSKVKKSNSNLPNLHTRAGDAS